MRVFKNFDNNFTKSILTLGFFDGVHLGHQKLLERLKEIAKSEGFETSVFTFSNHPKNLINHNDEVKLLNTADEKIELLKRFGINNTIIFPFTKEFSQEPFNEFFEEYIVKKINVGGILLGYDNKFGKNREGDYENIKKLAIANNVKVFRSDVFKIENQNISSSAIRNFLKNGQIEEANSMLGYNYFFNGTVIRGKGIGKQIGYPTANIQLKSDDKLIPAVGIYAVYVVIDNQKHKGMMSIGFNPTISSNNKLTIEVNVFDLNQDLYDKEIRIETIAKTRNEIKFNNLDELISQLGKDKIRCINELNRL